MATTPTQIRIYEATKNKVAKDVTIHRVGN